MPMWLACRNKVPTRKRSGWDTFWYGSSCNGEYADACSSLNVVRENLTGKPSLPES
jgi:hypothetical protein